MKILHLTDTHLTGKNPASRLDVYYQSLIEKLDEITIMIEEEDVELVIHTGDLFHSPRVAPKLVGDILTRFRKWNCPILIVPGNHDLDGYNIGTIEQTMLGLVAKTGLIHLLTRSNPYEVDINGFTLRIEGQEYHSNLDKGNPLDYQMMETKDCNLLAVHGMLMEAPYFPEVPHTLIENVETNAQIVLCGHYHPGFEQICQNGTVFLNPGSMARVEISHREPKLYLLDIQVHDFALELMEVKELFFKRIASSSEIFDFERHEEKKEAKQQLLTLKDTIQKAVSMSQGHPLDSILEEVAKTQMLSEEVVKSATAYIDEAKRQDPTLNQEIKGYTASSERVWLTEVEVEHFLAHDVTTFKLDPNFNVILGETDSGKTSLIRAIIWCLYNEPRGTDFIRTGESYVRVACTFSHGYRIERFRTKTQAGYYEITVPDGVVERYQGFGTDLPVQVLDAHQMPSVFLTKDQSVKLTVNEQLDAPFLIAESPQTKAMMIGRLVGTHYMDAAIKLLNKRNTNAQRTIKTYQAQIQTWEGQLKQFDDLEQQALLIETLDESYKQKERLESQIEHMKSCLSVYQAIQSQKERCQNVLSTLVPTEEAFKWVEKADILIQEIKKCQSLLYESQEIQSKYTKLNENPITLDFKTIETVIKEGQETLQWIQQACYLQQKGQVLDTKIQSVPTSSLTLEPYYQAEAEVEPLIDDLNRHVALLNQLADLDLKIMSVENHLMSQAEADESGIHLQEAHTQLQALYKKQGVCPNCGTKYGKKQLDFLLSQENHLC